MPQRIQKLSKKLTQKQERKKERKRITKHTRIPDTMKESQHKQGTANLDFTFFNHGKITQLRML